MNKETEIRNMLHYLTDNSTNRISGDFIVRGQASYQARGYVASAFAYKIKQDNSEVTIDYANLTIKIYAWNENCHNGDHCDERYIDVPWSKLHLIHDCLKDEVRDRAKKEAIEELYKRIAEGKLQAVLEGKS